MSQEFRKIRFGLWYDFRNPPQWRQPADLLYGEILDQIAWGEVVDPDAAIAMIREFVSNVPITHFYSWTLPPGLPPRWAQTHLELFASKVIPAFR